MFIWIIIMILIYLNIYMLDIYVIPVLCLSLTEVLAPLIENIIVHMNGIGNSNNNLLGTNSGRWNNTQFNKPKGPEPPRNNYSHYKNSVNNNDDENGNENIFNIQDIPEVNRLKRKYSDFSSEQAKSDIKNCMKRKLISFLHQQKEVYANMRKQNHEIYYNNSPITLQDREYLADLILEKRRNATNLSTRKLYTDLVNEIKLESDGVNRYQGGINENRIRRIFD